MCDLCELGAPQRPSAAELFRATVSGQARLDLQLPNLRAHENARAAVAIEAKERAALILALGDGYFSQINATPVSLTLAGSASGCFDPASNAFSATAAPSIRVAVRDQAQLRMVAAPAGTAIVTEGTAPIAAERCP